MIVLFIENYHYEKETGCSCPWREGYNLVLTHGNGPQVGNILMRNDAGEQMYNIAQMPIDICVADSQGGIGYMIERMLRNVLNKH